MYKLHLILKYLRKRRIAWVSLVAVTLCTAMVLVVISVMGGWLRMFRESFHGLTGDVIVHGESLSGFPYYQEMIDRIHTIPHVKRAVPTLETFGLVNVNNLVRRGVQVVGYRIDQIGDVNEFPSSLHRQFNSKVEEAEKSGEPLTEQEKDELKKKVSFDLPLPPEEYRAILSRVRNPEKKSGMICGIGVLGIKKDKEGKWPERNHLLDLWVNLTVLPIDAERRGIDTSTPPPQDIFWIVDDSRTGIWQADQASVYVPFDVLQRMLDMDAREERDPETNTVRKIEARTRDIQVSALPGNDIYELKRQVQKVVDQVIADRAIPAYYPITVETWEESQATFIAAIEKEKALVTILFGMISIVAVFLIFCIFYMIVVEKTKDIGIIKSVGATNAGVAGIFLGYGLAIGVVGAGMGLLFGYLIVHNINWLHEQMFRTLGQRIWDPEVYAFDTIPNTMDPKEVTVILVVAMLSALLGAIIPAWRAARMHPVDALRWE